MNLTCDTVILLLITGSIQVQTYVHQKTGLRTHWWPSGKEVPLPVQGAWVRFLVWEDFTCLRANKPV